MPLRDLLLHLQTYPTPLETSAIDQALDFCRGQGAQLTLHAAAVALPVGRSTAEALLGLGELAAEEERRCKAQAEKVLDYASLAAAKAEVQVHRVMETAAPYQLPGLLAREARAHDLTLLPVHGGRDATSELVERLVFGAGRPVLLYDPAAAPLTAAPPRQVMIAWDGSRWAARAVADALPLLAQTDRIQLLTVLGEKPGLDAELGLSLQRHLACHRLTAEFRPVPLGDGTIGDVLAREAAGADLLVMGAFGHSRLHEFVLGGATRSVMRAPPCPVLMSH